VHPLTTTSRFSADEIELLSCVIAAPNHENAAAWLGCSPTHLRRRLKQTRDRFRVETNAQLIVLASVSRSIDLDRVLPYGCRSGERSDR
jgi:hypothetical protein